MYFFIISFVLCFLSVHFFCLSVAKQICNEYEVKIPIDSVPKAIFPYLQISLLSLIPFFNLFVIYLILFTDFDKTMKERIIEEFKENGWIE